MPETALAERLTRRAMLMAGVLAVAGCNGNDGADRVNVVERGAAATGGTGGTGGTGSTGGTGGTGATGGTGGTGGTGSTGGTGGTGGTGSSGGTPVSNRAPTWLTVPTITFMLGVPATFPVSAFVSDPDGDPLTISHVGVLPAGVTFDPVNQRFLYDGSGAVQTTRDHVLSADDLK